MAEGLVGVFEPTMPIFVLEGNDVAVYTSVADAERELEPHDVVAGSLRGFRCPCSAAGPYSRWKFDPCLVDPSRVKGRGWPRVETS